MKTKSTLISFILVLSSGCATIMKDDSQPVAFSSEPQGAVVVINNVPRGTTPSTIMIKRKRGKTMITIQKDGYHPETFPLDKSVAGMTFGNIIFGGLIGVGVDVATGKASDYQDSVHINLRPVAGNQDKKKENPGTGPPSPDIANDFKRKLMLRVG